MQGTGTLWANDYTPPCQARLWLRITQDKATSLEITGSRNWTSAVRKASATRGLARGGGVRQLDRSVLVETHLRPTATAPPHRVLANPPGLTRLHRPRSNHHLSHAITRKVVLGGGFWLDAGMFGSQTGASPSSTLFAFMSSGRSLASRRQAPESTNQAQLAGLWNPRGRASHCCQAGVPAIACKLGSRQGDPKLGLVRGHCDRVHCIQPTLPYPSLRPNSWLIKHATLPPLPASIQPSFPLHAIYLPVDR